MMFHVLKGKLPSTDGAEGEVVSCSSFDNFSINARIRKSLMMQLKERAPPFVITFIHLGTMRLRYSVKKRPKLGLNMSPF